MTVLTSAILLFLLGATNAVKLPQRLNKPINLDFAETGAEQTAHSCQFAVNRIKAGPSNYKSIIGSGKSFTDVSFPPNSEMVRWNDLPSNANFGSIASSAQFFRLKDKISTDVYGNDVSEFDIMQGQISDCFYISPSGENAMYDDRIKRIF